MFGLGEIVRLVHLGHRPGRLDEKNEEHQRNLDHRLPAAERKLHVLVGLNGWDAHGIM